MNILVSGSGASGSWVIRGEQLGRAIGATVIPKARDVAAFDLAVLVKRPSEELVARVHKAGIPLVWDVVDSWPQPQGNDWCEAEALGWLKAKFNEIRPTAIVAATRAMADDCAEFGVPVLCLPHHARPGLKRVPIRPMKVVGYEGGEPHLGTWAKWLHGECKRRGWRFVINPTSITECDVLVALREKTGYAPTNWKSNVKLANAQAAGIPIICAPEAGYIETASGAEWFCETRDQVRSALDALEPMTTRAAISSHMVTAEPRLSEVAKTYRAWLNTLI